MAAPAEAAAGVAGYHRAGLLPDLLRGAAAVDHDQCRELAAEVAGCLLVVAGTERRGGLLAEEAFFRGLLQSQLIRWFGAWPGIIVAPSPTPRCTCW